MIRALCLDPLCRDCSKSNPPFRIHPSSDPRALIETTEEIDGAVFTAWCDCGSSVVASSRPADPTLNFRRAFLSNHVGAGHRITNGRQTVIDAARPRQRKARP